MVTIIGRMKPHMNDITYFHSNTTATIYKLIVSFILMIFEDDYGDFINEKGHNIQLLFFNLQPNLFFA